MGDLLKGLSLFARRELCWTTLALQNSFSPNALDYEVTLESYDGSMYVMIQTCMIQQIKMFELSFMDIMGFKCAGLKHCAGSPQNKNSCHHLRTLKIFPSGHCLCSAHV